MWGGITKRLKDFADELASPHFEDEGVKGMERIGAGVVALHKDEVQLSASRNQYTPPKRGGEETTKKDTAHADEPVATHTPPVLDQTLPDRAFLPGNGSGGPRAAADTSPRPSQKPVFPVNIPNTEAIRLVQAAGMPPDAPPRKESVDQNSRTLQQQIQALVNEKSQLENAIVLYQEQVSKCHTDTVSYYEAQQRMWQEEVESARSLKSAYECLSNAHRILQVKAQTLQEQVCVLEAEGKHRGVAVLDEAKCVAGTQTESSPMIHDAPDELESSMIEREGGRQDEAQSQQSQRAFTEQLQFKMKQLLEKYSDLQETIVCERVQHRDHSNDLETRWVTSVLQVEELEKRVEILQEQLLNTMRSFFSLVLTGNAFETAAAAGAELIPPCQEDRQTIEEVMRARDVELEEMKRAMAASEKLREQQHVDVMRAAEAGWRAQMAGLEDKSRLPEEALDQLASARTEIQEGTRVAQQQAEALSPAEGKLAAKQVAHQEELSRLSAGDASIASLSTMKRKLEGDLAQRQELMQRLQETIVECLTQYADVELVSQLQQPSGASGEDAFRKERTLSEWVILLTSEFARMATAVRQAEHVQSKWAETYEQARAVNNMLNQQVSDAWRIIGELREDTSVKEENAKRVDEQLRASETALQRAQERIEVLVSELHAAKEECETGAAKEQAMTSDVAAQQEQLISLECEVKTLQAALQEREEELTTALHSLENLQCVLDRFRENKNHDMEERMVHLLDEIDVLKTQLSQAHKDQERYEASLEQLRAQHRQELAESNMESTALHRKLAELRAALERTAKHLSGETTIDKQVVSHVLVNFVHAFVARRKEADEMLKVLSGLLGWDEATQERAGLLPGPLNPRSDAQQTAGDRRAGFFHGWNRTRAGVNGRTSASSGSFAGVSGEENTHGERSTSLATMWVEFLMRESEGSFPATSSALPMPDDALGSGASTTSMGSCRTARSVPKGVGL